MADLESTFQIQDYCYHKTGQEPLNYSDDYYVYEIYKKRKAVFVSLRNSEVLNLTIPYKIQSYLSAGKLIIGSVSGITKKIIINNKLGFCCKNDDIEKLEEIIAKVYFLKIKELKKIEKNSRNYFEKNFQLKNTIKKLSKIINA